MTYPENACSVVAASVNHRLSCQKVVYTASLKCLVTVVGIGLTLKCRRTLTTNRNMAFPVK